MTLNGKIVRCLDDIRKNFWIDEIVEKYYSGELIHCLESINEIETVRKLREIPKNNAFLLIHIYEALGLNVDFSDEEIRANYS